MKKKNKTDSSKTQLISGTAEQFNISPRGHYEGLLVRSKSGLVQANFTEEIAASIAEAVKAGDGIRMDVREDKDDRPRDHPVYELLKLHLADGGVITVRGKTSGGKVERLNYARHGEVNGAVLDSGDFVHVKPHGAKLLGLKVGQTLEVEGERKPMSSGAGSVINAEVVNGTKLGKGGAAKKKAVKKPAKKHAAKKKA